MDDYIINIELSTLYTLHRIVMILQPEIINVMIFHDGVALLQRGVTRGLYAVNTQQATSLSTATKDYKPCYYGCFTPAIPHTDRNSHNCSYHISTQNTQAEEQPSQSEAVFINNGNYTCNIFIYIYFVIKIIFSS